MTSFSRRAVSTLRMLVLLLGTSAGLVSGQAYSFCNPLKVKCPPAPGFSSSEPYISDFRTGSDDRIWTSVGRSSSPITYGNNAGAKFTINRQGDCPVLESDQYLFFGSVEVHLRAAAGQGLVSCIVLLGDSLDEIDFEFLGGQPHRSLVQSNYFGKGETGNFENGEGHWLPRIPSSTTEEVHNYTIDWDHEKIVWFIDGVQVRRLDRPQARPVSLVLGRDNFPQTPARVRIGLWAGGDPTNEQGTIDWAGGVVNYDAGREDGPPYEMVVEYVRVVNKYPAAAYWSKDFSGQWEGIERLGRYFERGDRGEYVKGYGEAIEGGYTFNTSRPAARSDAGIGRAGADTADGGHDYHKVDSVSGTATVDEPNVHALDDGQDTKSDESEEDDDDERGQDPLPGQTAWGPSGPENQEWTGPGTQTDSKKENEGEDKKEKENGESATVNPGHGDGHHEPEPKPGNVGTGGTREAPAPGIPERPNGTPVVHLDHLDSLSVVKARLDGPWKLVGVVAAAAHLLFLGLFTW